jgi:hypothetical protein
MKRSLLILTGFSSLVLAACGSSGGSSGDGSAPGDGSTSTGDTAGTGPGDGSLAGDSPAGTDGAAGTDQAPGIDMGTTAMDPGIPAMGDHYCMNGPQASEDVQVLLGFDSTCTITKAPMPPLTAMQKMSYDYFCTFYGGATKVVDNCPRDNVVAYCLGQGVAPGTKGWKLIYKSKATPDADAVALNPLGLCGLDKIYDASGAPIPPRSCKGTFSAKVNGVDKAFTEHRVCSYRGIATKGEYAIIGDTTTGDRMTLLIGNDNNGVYKVGNAVYPSAGYLEGSKVFAVANPAMQMVTVSKFELKNAVLTGTFTIGELRNANESRTITDGVIDLTISP